MEVIENKKALQFVKTGLGKSKILKSNAGDISTIINKKNGYCLIFL